MASSRRAALQQPSKNGLSTGPPGWKELKAAVSEGIVSFLYIFISLQEIF